MLERKGGGSVVEKYVKFEEHGNRYLGTIFSRLPRQSEKFAAVAPWLMIEQEYMDILLRRTFGEVRNPKLKRLAKYLISSLIFHHDFLLEYLDHEHPFRRSKFANSFSANKVKSLCQRISFNTTRATGSAFTCDYVETACD